MKNITLLIFISFLSLSNYAQEKEKPKDKKSIKEVLKEIPDMLIAAPDAAVDTNANRLINDNIALDINPLWKEKGLQTIIEYKLQKTDAEPLQATMPVPDKKIVQVITINSGTSKKPLAEKKQAVLAQIKNHVAAFYKEAGVSITATELNEKTNAMLIGTETFTTAQGKTGELYYLNDIDPKQSALTILYLVPTADGTKTNFAQFSYIRYNYETTYPEDILEWKTFVYADEQKAYIDFTKKILKTMRIQ